MHNDTHPEELIGPYLAGELDSATAERVERYVEEQVGRRGVLAGVRAILRSQQLLPAGEEALEALKQSVLERLETQIGKEVVPSAKRTRGLRCGIGSRGSMPTPGMRRLALATGIVATMVAAFIVAKRAPTNNNIEAVRTYASAAGQRQLITLGTGTRVLLAPASTMTIASSMRGAVATVVGQAMFTVAPNDRVPFTVRTGSAVTRVLGTTFFVRRFASETVTEVLVTEGRVSVSDARRDDIPVAVVSAGMRGVVDDSGRVTVRTSDAVDSRTAWTEGRLVFSKTPVADVVAELGRTYDVDIYVADSSVARDRLTWTVPVGDRTVSQALDALMAALGTHYTRAGRVITIFPGAAAPTRRFKLPRSLTQEPQYGR